MSLPFIIVASLTGLPDGTRWLNSKSKGWVKSLPPPLGRPGEGVEQAVKGCVTSSQLSLLMHAALVRLRSMDLASRFRELRVRAGLTKTALARPKYTVSYVSQIESGRRNPSS